MPLAVNEQSDEILALACEWPVLEALQAGTPAMRQARTLYLPQWPNEEAASYNARLATATLFPAYKRTVGVMSSKPFAKALTLSEDTPETVKQWADDIDLQGVSLHSFAAEMFNEVVGYGCAGILVEFPSQSVEEGTQETVAQREASGRRPYFVRVMHDQVLGYKTEVVNGRVRLTQLRLSESTTEDDGEYGTKVVPMVRVLRPGSWEVWKQTSDTWVLDSSGTTTLTEIPFVPLYGIRDGFMVGKPALLDLAYLNVKHWQSQSDQDTILHVARVPILAMIGADDETQLVVGAQCAVKLPENAKLEFVEHTGASITAGKESLLQLEEQMVQTGAELLVQKPGERTATEDANDAEGNKSDLQRMAENFEDALDIALGFAAQYASLPTGGSVSLFSDFGAATLSDASATLIKDLQMAGLLSKETALKEIQRRGFLSPDVNVDEELERIEADGPPLGAQLDMMAIETKAKTNANDE